MVSQLHVALEPLVLLVQVDSALVTVLETVHGLAAARLLVLIWRLLLFRRLEYLAPVRHHLDLILQRQILIGQGLTRRTDFTLELVGHISGGINTFHCQRFLFIFVPCSHFFLELLEQVLLDVQRHRAGGFFLFLLLVVLLGLSLGLTVRTAGRAVVELFVVDFAEHEAPERHCGRVLLLLLIHLVYVAHSFRSLLEYRLVQ